LADLREGKILKGGEMKSKVRSIVASLGILTLLIISTPLADNEPAMAALSSDAYGVISVPNPTPTALWGCNITDMAVGSDGNTIYIIDGTLTNKVYKSTDGGHNFAALTLPPNFAASPRAIAVAPDNPNFVAVVASSGGLPGKVFVSTDGGSKWQDTNCPAVDSISTIAISPNYDGYDIAIGTRTGGGGGDVYVLKSAGFGGWASQGFSGDILVVKFSPSYRADSTLATISTHAAGTYINLGVHDIAANTTNWGTWGPVEVTTAGAGTSPNVAQIITADMELPADFSGQAPSLRRMYVSIDTPTANAGIYRFDDTVGYLLMPTPAPLRISSIAYYGTYASGKLLAGMQANTQVYHTTNPQGISPAWYSSTVPPPGDTDVVLGMHPNCAINHICYAGTSGVGGGFFSISTDNGITFSPPSEPPGTTITTVEYKFASPEIKPIRIPTGPGIMTAKIHTGENQRFETFDQIQMMDLHNYGKPGEPVLPYKTGHILIPQGHSLVSVSADIGEKIRLPGKYMIEPGQVAIPTSSGESTYTPPNPDIYLSKNPFPASPFQVISVQSFRGYQILLVNLMPIEYIPAEKEVSYFSSIKVSVKTAPIEYHNPLYRGTSKDEERAKAMVDNPGLLKEYLPTNGPAPASLPPGDYDMVIITNSTLTPTFQNYADWRTNRRGIRTIVYDIATILTTYSGYDDAEKVRNFIIDAYTTWGIEYVLLGGDVEIVPYRSLYCKIYITSGWITENIPADIYYAGLDGTWDSDSDHIYGEMSPTDEADLLAEVYVGRDPVNNITEAQNVCNKIRSYEESNLGTYRCDWLFFATILDSSTNGGDYKDDTENKELHPPHGFNITKVYQHLGGTSAQVIAALNTGQRIGNAAGHGNYDGFGMLNRTDVDNLTNTEYCLIYTFACLTNKFEEVDAISEHFLYTAHGAFAYIGNSRYGLYYSGDASGPSHDFELEFYDALIDEEIPRVGWALQDSKEEFSGSSSAYHRWIYYALNMLGDPSTLLRIKNDLLIRDHPADDGSLPSGSVFWTSPDIAVDQPLNGWQTPAPPSDPFIVHENPEYGDVNRVYIRVHNMGCEDANDATVSLYWADPAGGIPWPSDWNPIAENIPIPPIPAGGKVTAPYIEWTPTGTAIGHRCLLATVETTDDPISIHSVPWDNNLAQLNVHIVNLGSSYKTDFVLNPLKQQGERNLKITLLKAPKGASAKLQIPSTVQIGGVKEVSSTRAPLSRWIPSCLPSCQQGRQVTVTSPSEGADTTAVVSNFDCDRKEVVNLEIAVPSDADTGGEFTIRIIEELDGETSGGIDYIVRY
jgi:hypothetical protein